MPVSVKVVFNGEMVRRVVGERVPRLMTAIGAEYTNDVKRSMKASPRGGANVNKRGQKRSAPGEPPAPEFGDLIRSVRFQVRQVGERWLVEAGSTLRKAVYLEFGAARGRTQQARDSAGKYVPGLRTMSWILYPRPVWGPAIMRIKARIPSILSRIRRR